MKPRDGRLRNHPLPHPIAANAAPLRERGFTLLDIVLVLVIAGLLVQAVIYGQSLIEAARVQALVAQQGAVTAALLAFQDRFRAWPGDYGNTQAAIDCEGSPCPGGNDNGVVEASSSNEDIIAWTQLSATGFLSEYFRIESPTTMTALAGQHPAQRLRRLSAHRFRRAVGDLDQRREQAQRQGGQLCPGRGPGGDRPAHRRRPAGDGKLPVLDLLGRLRGAAHHRGRPAASARMPPTPVGTCPGGSPTAVPYRW